MHSNAQLSPRRKNRRVPGGEKGGGNKSQTKKLLGVPVETILAFLTGKETSKKGGEDLGRVEGGKGGEAQKPKNTGLLLVRIFVKKRSTRKNRGCRKV